MACQGDWPAVLQERTGVGVGGSWRRQPHAVAPGLLRTCCSPQECCVSTNLSKSFLVRTQNGGPSRFPTHLNRPSSDRMMKTHISCAKGSRSKPRWRKGSRDGVGPGDLGPWPMATLQFLFPLNLCFKVTTFTNDHRNRDKTRKRGQEAILFPKTNLLYVYSFESSKRPKILERRQFQGKLQGGWCNKDSFVSMNLKNAKFSFL